MHRPLEAYLEQVAAHLSALPTKRRNEELREMRQHLLNAVTVNRELGQPEEDAVANSVMQFGTPEDLGNNLVWAWRRGEARNKKYTKQKRVRLSVLFGTLGAVLSGSLFCLTGNPTPKDTWSHRFANQSYFYLNSHLYPSEFRVYHAKDAAGIAFGRGDYIIETK